MSEKIYNVLIKTRLDIFQCLPIDKREKLALQRGMDRIGATKP